MKTKFIVLEHLLDSLKDKSQLDTLREIYLGEAVKVISHILHRNWEEPKVKWQ